MNTVVIAAHGCPVWPLGAYGNEWIATPTLDRLAAEGVTFDRHYARRPDPLGARADWWGITPPSPPTPLPQGERGDLLPLSTQWESGLGGEGGAIIRASRPAFDAPPHYYAGFAEVFDARPESARPPLAPLLALLPSVLHRNPSLLWIETDGLIPPWFAPAEVFEVYCEDLLEDDTDSEPLTPWPDPPVGWFDRHDLASWELLHRTYAAALTCFDADLGRVIDLLRAKGWDESATWAFTADYGHPLGHHGLLGPHRPWLHEEFVHLPLIVRKPGAKDAGERVWSFTQPADVMGLVSRETKASATRASVISNSDANGHREAALRTDTHALLLPLSVPHDEERAPLLFEKPDDRWELNDVRQPNLGLADEMEAELRKHLEGTPYLPGAAE